MARISTFSCLLVFVCISGCLLSGAERIDRTGLIPIDPARWYQLNNGDLPVAQLFNGNEQDKIVTLHKGILDNYDLYYPLLEGEQITIDSIKLYDWEGSDPGHPTTIYGVMSDWHKVLLATFTGEQYKRWVGPDPHQPDKYALAQPVSGIRYIVINTWGQLPGEIEFYGPYKPAKAQPAAAVTYVPLRNFFGVNAFEWDFEDPNNPAQLDPSRTAAINNFTAVRHYMDWEKIEARPGYYSFAPTSSGGWNYDVMYDWCKQHNIEVLACLKTVPAWIKSTYPADQQDDENTPMAYGKDPALPASYVEQAKAGFQFAARYGANKNIDASLIKLQPDNVVHTGLGLVKYIECDNERDKWWKGRKAYQTGREYAANLSAFYDGNKNTMGKGVGVKNADPTMKVVMAGLATPSTDYVEGMIDWCKENRGYKPDGSLDCPWDVVNYHFYANDACLAPSSTTQTTGIAPELAKTDSFAARFINLSHRLLGDMPVWVTEAGYDIHPGSPQKATAMAGKTAEQVQADWILRTSLLYARTGVQKVFFYELCDDNPGNNNRYATSGLVERTRQSRPAANFIAQVAKRFGGYTYRQTINKQPSVDRYSMGSSDMYSVVLPTQSGKKMTYSLNVGKVSEATIYTPVANSPEMSEKKIHVGGGKIDIAVTETPVFVVVEKKG